MLARAAKCPNLGDLVDPVHTFAGMPLRLIVVIVAVSFQHYPFDEQVRASWMNSVAFGYTIAATLASVHSTQYDFKPCGATLQTQTR